MNNRDQKTISQSVDIESFFHDTGKGRIFCTLIGTPHPSKECVVYFSPLFEERMWSHRIAFNFALELAARGKQVVLMFDYHGYGESDGEPESFTLARCRDDMESLLALMGTLGFTRFSWWGIRTGCAVSLAVLPPHLLISSAFLWAPVLNLQEFIYDSLRATIAAQYMIFNKAVVTRDIILEELAEFGQCSRDGYLLNYIEGYRFGKTFYQETQNLEHLLDLNLLTFPSLVLELLRPGMKIAKTDIKPSKVREASRANQNISYLQVTDRQFWLIGKDYSQRAEALYRATAGWLDERSS